MVLPALPFDINAIELGMALLHLHLVRGIVSAATHYRHFRSASSNQSQDVLDRIQNSPGAVLHWIDNFAKYYKSSGMNINEDLLRSVLWTAHGVKFHPLVVGTAWVYKEAHPYEPVPAMPLLDVLLDEKEHLAVRDVLATIPRLTYDVLLQVNEMYVAFHSSYR